MESSPRLRRALLGLLTRQANFTFLNCLRLITNSSATAWMVCECNFKPASPAPLVYGCKSKAEMNLRSRSKTLIDRSLQKFQTMLTSVDRALK